MKIYFLILILLIAWTNINAMDVGTVTLVRGKVWVVSKNKPNQTRRKVQVKSKIQMMDQLHTGKNSILRFQTVTQTIITLGPSSTLEITDFHAGAGNSPRREFFTILKGKIRSSVTKKTRDKEKVRFKTNDVAFGVRGTQFLVNAGGKSTDLALLTGQLNVNTSKLGSNINSFTMEAGQVFNTSDFAVRGLEAVKKLKPEALKSLMKENDKFLPNLSDPVSGIKALTVVAAAAILGSDNSRTEEVKARVETTARTKVDLQQTKKSKVKAPLDFQYNLKEEPQDIREAILNQKKLREEEGECYFWFYKRILQASEPERFRRTRDCDDFEFDL